jgi:hypothetical protein
VEEDADLFARFRHPLTFHCFGAHEQGPTVLLRWEDEEGRGESGDSASSFDVRMACFQQSRGEHRDLNANNVVIIGVERKDFRLPSSVEARNADSGISQLEYGSQVFDTKSGFS